MLNRGVVVTLLAFAIVVISAPWATSAQEEESRVPAFHSAPPPANAKLAPILGREKLWGNNDEYPFQSHSYELAAKIDPVLYQQPCYCYCDRMGHKSLRSCFESTHGAQCATCMKEVYYSYQMSKQHKTAAQIRKGIIAGEWKQIDLQSAASIN
jgi:hypothetical protein